MDGSPGLDTEASSSNSGPNIRLGCNQGNSANTPHLLQSSGIGRHSSYGFVGSGHGSGTIDDGLADLSDSVGGAVSGISSARNSGTAAGGKRRSYRTK